MRSFAPPASLATRVASFDVVESDGGESVVLPSTGAVLGLQFRGRVHAPEGPLALAGVTGVQSSARRYAYARHTGSVLVRFTPQGAACLGVPAHELANRSVPLEELLGRPCVEVACERLAASGDDRARVAIVADLVRRLPFARDPLVTRALSLLGDAGRASRIAEVAAELGLSARQLARRFEAQVGVSPKQWAKLRRFEHASRLVATAPSLAAAAQEAGYYDQSHFVRDVRAFTGQSPGQLEAHFPLQR